MPSLARSNALPRTLNIEHKNKNKLFEYYCRSKKRVFINRQNTSAESEPANQSEMSAEAQREQSMDGNEETVSDRDEQEK